MSDTSFAQMATATASTKRNPAAAGGKVGVPVANLAALAVTPPMPVSPELANYYRLNSPRENFVVYSDGAAVDVLEGDEMTISAVTYRVQAVGQWPTTDGGFAEIIIQKVKGA